MINNNRFNFPTINEITISSLPKDPEILESNYEIEHDPRGTIAIPNKNKADIKDYLFIKKELDLDAPKYNEEYYFFVNKLLFQLETTIRTVGELTRKNAELEQRLEALEMKSESKIVPNTLSDHVGT